MRTTAVIMAGGKGERFWPKSRSGMPKQFLSLTGDGNTMIQLTARRLLPLVSYSDMFVVTNKAYVGLVREQLPEIPAENILAEPVARNTAPCVGYAAEVISSRYGDAVMVVLPSDHLIKLEEMYIDTMSQAIEVAAEDSALVTIGITPAYPETGYGYINFGEGDGKRHGVYGVKRFVEKPDIDTAKEYLESGKYLWNSGMFVWKASTILQKFEELLPDTYEGLVKIRQAIGTAGYEDVLQRVFQNLRPESIDYGIMERAEPIFTIPGSFGWDDVGSWLALERINKASEDGNVEQGNVITVGTKNSVVVGEGRLIAVVGVEDVVVVDTGDAVLVCAKHAAQDVKKVIETLKAQHRDDLI